MIANMTAADFAKWLAKSEACLDGISWASARRITAAEAWAQSEQNGEVFSPLLRAVIQRQS
jgi:hypothetical protein